jgi:hypothetical protein
MQFSAPLGRPNDYFAYALPEGSDYVKPEKKKMAIREYAERALAHVKGRKGDMTAVAIEGVESVATGLGVAFIGSQISLDQSSIPIDGVAGLLALGASAFMPVPNIIHRTGDRLLTIASYRKGVAMFPAAAVSGDFDEGATDGFGTDDNLLKAAAAL